MPADTEYVDYRRTQSALDGWIVYGVKADGWHDRIDANLTESEASEQIRRLKATLAEPAGREAVSADDLADAIG